MYIRPYRIRQEFVGGKSRFIVRINVKIAAELAQIIIDCRPARRGKELRKCA
jgi:hypothetical protein